MCRRRVHDPYGLGDRLERLLLAETPQVAHAGALCDKGMARETVDTAVQPKAIGFAQRPNCQCGIWGLNRLATKHGVKLLLLLIFTEDLPELSPYACIRPATLL